MSQRQEKRVDKHEHKVFAHNRDLPLRFLSVVFCQSDIVNQERYANKVDKEENQRRYVVRHEEVAKL